jgi:raffinose/stachyose/melibiose transport system substrate-binding protein
MKTRTTIGMCLVIALVFAGLAYAQETVITVWDWSTSQSPVIEHQIEVFESKHPGIKVERQAISSNSGVYWTRVMLGIQADDLPDVVAFGNDRVAEWVDSGRFIPITDYYEASPLNGEILQPAVDVFRHNGELWAIPTILYHVTILANEDVFVQNSISLPQTWDELLDVCKVLKEKGVYPILMGGNKPVYIAIWFENLASINGSDLYGLRDGKFDLATPENVEALELLVELAEYMNPDWPTADNDDMKSELALGNGAMFLTGPWTLEPASRIKPDVNFKAIAMPYNESIKGKTYVGGQTAYGISTSCKNPDVAWTFIEWMTGHEGATLYTEGGQISPNLTVSDEAYFSQPAADWVALSAENTQPLATYPNQSEVRSIVTDACVRAMLGQASAEEALEQATVEANRSIGK